MNLRSPATGYGYVQGIVEINGDLYKMNIFYFCFHTSCKVYTIQEKYKCSYFILVQHRIYFPLFCKLFFSTALFVRSTFYNFRRHFSHNTCSFQKYYKQCCYTKEKFLRRNNWLPVRLHMLLNYIWMFIFR